MQDASWFDSALFSWVILPVLIFCSRVIDVSFGTLRIIFISRGKRLLAPALGFFEVLIWLLAIGQIFQHLTNFVCYVAYAAGFASGNFVGMYIENRLAIGMQVVRIITSKDATKLIADLRANGFGLTLLDGEGAQGPVKIVFTLIKRKALAEVIASIKKHNPKAFFSVEDVKMAVEGIFPETNTRPMSFFWQKLKWDRKGK